MDNTKTLDTERLILRKFTIDDAEGMFNNWATDSETNKFLSWPIHNNIEETKGVISKWISNYENDKRVPDIALLQKLCDKFGVSMNYLLRGNPYNEELDALTKTETDISLYLTKDGHLDLSDAPPMVKIFIVDLYQFLMQKYCK